MIRLVCCQRCQFVVVLANGETTWPSCPRCAACRVAGIPDPQMPMALLQLPDGFEVTKTTPQPRSDEPVQHQPV